jgi:acetyl-CoA synthetase
MKGGAIFGAAAGAAWLPSEREIARSRLAGAMKRWGYASLADLQRDAVDKPEWFWRVALDDLGVTFTTLWTGYVDISAGRAFPRWFTGGRLNVATHCVERHARQPGATDRIAITYEGDSGVRREMSYALFGTEVERIAAGLVALGIGKGDRVGLFLPVVPEAAVALMACAKIGAIAVPAFSGYGPEPLAARLRAADVAALITVDGTTRRGKRIPMKDIADAAVALAGGVKHVLVVRNDNGPVTLHEGRDHNWADFGREAKATPTLIWAGCWGR